MQGLCSLSGVHAQWLLFLSNESMGFSEVCSGHLGLPNPVQADANACAPPSRPSKTMQVSECGSSSSSSCVPFPCSSLTGTTASPPGLSLRLCLCLHHCLGHTTCQHVSHLLWSCVRSKGWENTTPKPTSGTSQNLEIHELQVPFRVEDKRPSGAAPSEQATSMVGTEQSKEMAGLLSPLQARGPSPALPTPVASGEKMPNVAKVISSYFLVASNMC